MPNVSNLVKTIQDIMRKDAGTYGDAQRLEQLGWMLFLKIFDDREHEMELLRDSYKSPLPEIFFSFGSRVLLVKSRSASPVMPSELMAHVRQRSSFERGDL